MIVIFFSIRLSYFVNSSSQIPATVYLPEDNYYLARHLHPILFLNLFSSLENVTSSPASSEELLKIITNL